MPGYEENSGGRIRTEASGLVVTAPSLDADELVRSQPSFNVVISVRREALGLSISDGIVTIVNLFKDSYQFYSIKNQRYEVDPLLPFPFSKSPRVLSCGTGTNAHKVLIFASWVTVWELREATSSSRAALNA